jgi:hypothetical protein
MAIPLSENENYTEDDMERVTGFPGSSWRTSVEDRLTPAQHKP